MSDGSAFDRLMHEVCVEKGWCGGIVDGKPKHVTDFLPSDGQVSAEQFVDWLLKADGVDPDEDQAKWQPHIDGLRAAFVHHMGADHVDAELLAYNVSGQVKRAAGIDRRQGGRDKVGPQADAAVQQAHVAKRLHFYALAFGTFVSLAVTMMAANVLLAPYQRLISSLIS